MTTFITPQNHLVHVTQAPGGKTKHALGLWKGKRCIEWEYVEDVNFNEEELAAIEAHNAPGNEGESRLPKGMRQEDFQKAHDQRRMRRNREGY